jgi:hypothetical protein
MISSQKLWPLDDEAGHFDEVFITDILCVLAKGYAGCKVKTEFYDTSYIKVISLD